MYWSDPPLTGPKLLRFIETNWLVTSIVPFDELSVAPDCCQALFSSFCLYSLYSNWTWKLLPAPEAVIILKSIDKGICVKNCTVCDCWIAIKLATVAILIRISPPRVLPYGPSSGPVILAKSMVPAIKALPGLNVLVKFKLPAVIALPEKGLNIGVPLPPPNPGSTPANVNEGKVQSISATPATFILGWPPKATILVPDPSLPGIWRLGLVEVKGPLNTIVPRSETVLGAGLNKVGVDVEFQVIAIFLLGYCWPKASIGGADIPWLPNTIATWATVKCWSDIKNTPGPPATEVPNGVPARLFRSVFVTVKIAPALYVPVPISVILILKIFPASVVPDCPDVIVAFAPTPAPWPDTVPISVNKNSADVTSDVAAVNSEPSKVGCTPDPAITNEDCNVENL